MYGPNHQQGHNTRLNGVPGGRGMAPQMMYNFVQQQSAHQHHTHPQPHHQNLPQDHGAHSGATGTITHSTFSSGLMSNVTPFTPSNHQNGNAPGSRGGQAQYSEHWNEQLKSFKESEQAHQTMTEQHQPHYFARLRASENRGIIPAPSANAAETAVDGELEDRGRPVNVDKALDRQDWLNLDFSGQGLKNISLMLFDHYAFVTELYLASNNLTRLPREIGQLRSLRLLDVSHNQLTTLPPELGMCTPLRRLLLYNNLIQTIPCELGALHFLELLGIQGNPLEHDQKQKLVEEGTKALIAHLKEQAPVPIPPNPRMPIIVQEDVGSEKERIRVMSWNTLCDKYATSTQYGYTPASALSWEYRKDSIMREFRDRSADILCLQETAMDAFDNFFSPELAKLGYKGVFYPKTRVKHLTGKDQQSVDGCSIFYKSDKYIMLDKQLVDFRQTAINRPDMKSADDVFNRVMPKDTIAVFCFFESRYTGNRFIVVNAHLCWESFLADVKAVQTGILMELVTKQSERYTRRPALSIEEKRIKSPPPSADGNSDDDDESPREPAPSQEYRNNTDIPILVCGDYNSMADSSVYELLEKGRIAPDHPDLVGHSYGNFTRDGIEHPFSLRNAYAHLFGTPDELTFTNYTPTFSGVIDYIWYTTNTLDVVELLGPPDYEYLKRVPGFPNYHFPADHIQIMGDFVFKSRKDKKTTPDQDKAGSSRNQSRDLN
ncbi:glucose-repressible alcohol dehydrogenase transcriptional effector [Annulohypoxylon truncatum]|uniref:glucose-repressible alcohol dehydrogenase transcriptional effector n=1 Tax=Annulohypoxylon truncatum TaxID=327061 RepID=UPI002008AE43|nr:glucose-repressible alcohol dehydrogenase transcriptional effector [Annulohypoxylon truncatum]KAI1215157.1 glucose-repressible alcohol dehydrogenase transcriptional effector [Annulohypoxylon truncatum]